MSTRREITTDIIEWVTKFSQAEDSRLDHDFLGHKVNQFRELGLVDEYEQTGLIDMNWIQPIAIPNFHKVNFSEDRTIDYCNCDLSKTTLPPIITLTDTQQGQQDIGIFSVRSLCGKYEYFYYPYGLFRMLTPDHPASKFNYYFRLGSNFFVNKEIEKLVISAILKNPFDGVVNDTLPRVTTELVTGTDYLVGDALIVHNSIIYQPGDTFTAANANFTGGKYVYLKDYQRNLTEDDEYPVSQRMARWIVWKILTEEFQLEKQQIADLDIDGTDETKYNR